MRYNKSRYSIYWTAKLILTWLLICHLTSHVNNPLLAQNVGIGTTNPAPTARLDIWDTTRGLLIPRLTTQQRDAIQNPAHTLIIFNIDSFCLEVYDTLTQQWYTISCPRLCQPPACTPTVLGPSFACTGDTITFIAIGCPDAVYQWSVPPGWSVISGQGSDTLKVVPDTTDGAVHVTVCNQCGCGASFSLSTLADSCVAFCIAIGDIGNDFSWKILSTADNGYFISGHSSSFGQGNLDIYVIKLDTNYTIQWTKTIGGTDFDESFSAFQSFDSGYVIVGRTRSFGQGNYDVYVLKLDASGNTQWTKTIGGTLRDEGWSIIQTTSDSGYILTGYTSSFGQGLGDILVAKLDGNGNLQWTKTIGGPNEDIAYSITQTADSGYILTGSTASFGQGGYDVYVVKISANGNLQWTRTIGGNNDDFGRAIIQTSDGGYAIAGRTQSFGQGNWDVYVIKLDSLGNLQWTRTIGGSNDDFGRAIIQTSDGGYAIAGHTQSFGQGNWDIYIIKLDGNGNIQWTKTIGGNNDELSFSIAQTSDGGYVITGYTNSFGQGNYDIYIVKLDPNGNLDTCPNGCQISTGGIASSGGVISNGGVVGSGGITSSGGTTSPSGGIATTICP